MNSGSATQAIYQTLYPLPDVSVGRCYLCNGPAHDSTPAKGVLKVTFTDYDRARGDAEDGICCACTWSLQESNPDAQRFFPKPLSLRMFSHFLINGIWQAFTKARKREMSTLLLADVMPEVAVVSESGQKHLLFKSRLNPPGQRAGWLLFEQRMVWLDLAAFQSLYAHVDALYQSRFTKEALLTGRYSFFPDTDLKLWREHESFLRSARGSELLALCIYLVTKEKEGNQDGQ